MASGAPQHCYRQLETGHIRVLELFHTKDAPAARQTETNQNLPLCGRLSHINLDETHNYDALSYVWGDPKATETILLQDSVDQTTELGITTNLAKALKAIRNQNQSSLFLWIDAICINQNDLGERSNQVQYMHRIYAQAARVRAWIDVQIDPNDKAIRRLSVLSPDHMTRFEKSELRDISMVVHVDPNEESDDDGVGDRGGYWQSLAKLCLNSYWKRVWIRQEIFFAKKLVIHCGEVSIEGEDFCEFLRQIEKRLPFNTPAEKQTFRDYREWANYLEPISAMRANRNLFYSKYNKSKRSQWERSSTPSGKSKKQDLCESLSFARDTLKATDPRDYVYGLLSLVDGLDEGKLQVKVDYSLDTAQVYTEAVRTVIKGYHSLRFLNASDIKSSRKELGIPSWVPDWGSRGNVWPLGKNSRLNLVSRTSTSQTEGAHPSISICGRILEVSGVRVGKILQVFEDVVIDDKWEPETSVKIWAAMYQQLETIARKASDIQLASGKQPNQLRWPKSADKPNIQRLAILKAIIAFECMEKDEVFLECLYEALEGMVDIMEAFQGKDQWKEMTLGTLLQWVVTVPGAKNRLTSRLIMVTEGRRLFISRDGQLGLAPEGAVVDDEVWFLPGCEVPMLLRPVGRNFMVVGEAHINEYPFTGTGPNFDEAFIKACKITEENEFCRISLV